MKSILFALAFLVAGPATAEPPEVAEQPVTLPAGTPEGDVEEPSPAAGEDASFEGFEDMAPPPRRRVFDPLEPVNRAFFVFNDRFYFWLWRPAARAYRFAVPEPARKGVNNVFTNVYFPIRFVNSLFQLKVRKAGAELGRFVVNSTVGLAGLWDPADRWLDWKAPPTEDFGQTLAGWGIGEGFPVTLPFLGPMNLRDGLGLIPDIFLTPYVYVVNDYEGLGIRSGDIFNRSSLHLGEYETLRNDALDPYTFFRDAYQQNRRKELRE